MTVISLNSALYAALTFAPERKKLTVYTKNPGKARTSIVAVLRKEVGSGWGDWQILSRPATSDPSLLPATWPTGDPEVISSRDLANVLQENPELWGDIDD